MELATLFVGRQKHTYVYVCINIYKGDAANKRVQLIYSVYTQTEQNVPLPVHKPVGIIKFSTE